MVSGAPILFYQQYSMDSCIISSFAAAVHYMGDKKAAEYINRRKEQSLVAFSNGGRMQFCNDVILNHYKQKNEKKLRYTVQNWNESKPFDIFKDISTWPTVCLLLDSAGRAEHCVTVCNKWIFDSNFDYAFPLSEQCLHYICGGDDEKDIKFVSVCQAIRAIPPIAVQQIVLSTNH